ncbi:unnamed protein product [Protopolystoma xenopodis]|uniref:Uncharacterized protein n=1 Tax=Protopolystoma xenopodis TaxID=117903 RepID=A0A3S4ZZV0_9PLAT|nr:unnamed protein product [Protopolystoma xenopodis]
MKRANVRLWSSRLNDPRKNPERDYVSPLHPVALNTITNLATTALTAVHYAYSRRNWLRSDRVRPRYLSVYLHCRQQSNKNDTPHDQVSYTVIAQTMTSLIRCHLYLGYYRTQ